MTSQAIRAFNNGNKLTQLSYRVQLHRHALLRLIYNLAILNHISKSINHRLTPLTRRPLHLFTSDELLTL